jgi:hypothetical protein
MKRTYLSGVLAAGIVASSCALTDDAPVAEAVSAATPATGHPRIWIRPADVTRLQSWATAANPMYAQGLQPSVAAALDTYNTQFYPNGQPNPTWPDPGDPNWVAYTTEAYAEIFAFMSLVDPDPTERAAYGARARNLLMHVMNEAVKGVDTSATPAPFRSPSFATYNRANYWGEAFGLTVDWAYPYFSAADKATIQKVFLIWSDECVHASTTSDEHPQPIGVLNDPSLLADTQQLRWAANNYYTGHMRDLTMMSLALDPADDPPVSASSPVNQLGNSMRSYLADVTGAWLYQQYAVYTDAATASAALGAPAAGLGVASGGLSVEGFLYGDSLGNLHEAMLALHTAGYDDPSISGPQAALVQSPYWDRYLSGFLQSIAATPQTPTDPNFNYLGPIYSMSSYGDILHFWIVPEMVTLFASLGVMDQTTGNTTRLPALRWIAENVIQGGAGQLYQRASSVWGNSYASFSILYFMLFDPTAATPADPRPGRPLVFTDPAFGRVVARTDWTPNATVFDYLCNWETINHQVGSANEFELWRKGEWLAKERTGYSNDFVFATSDYHDTLAIQNDTPADLAWFETATSARGGQWTNGDNAGDPTMLSSSGTAPGLPWVYAYGDATNLYNRPGVSAADSAMDVLHASRSIVWLEPDHVVVYDRATTKTASRFKRWNLTLLADPVISGHTATVTTAGGQRFTIQNLAPATATLTVSAAEAFDSVADLEPTQYRLVVEDPSLPADVRFLHVLEMADKGVPVGVAEEVQSATGTPFQGAATAGSVVMFPVDPSVAFAGTSYVAPAGTTNQLVTGLTPGAGYTVTTQQGSSGTLVSVTPGGSSLADAAGVLVVTLGASTPPPPPTGTGTGTPPPPPTGTGTGTPPPPPTQCAPSLSVTSDSFPAAGGTASVAVTAASTCAWTASSDVSWIWLMQPNTGTGDGTVGYEVISNTGAARTGQITIGGQTYTVTQTGK